MKERNNVDIIRFILEVSNEDGNTKKTSKIMYTTLFNHPQLKQYWNVLTQNDLLSYDSDAETFKTTEKGREFLEAYRRLDDMKKG